MITLTNPLTGEITEYPTSTPSEIADSWRQAQELEKLAKNLKDKLKPLVEPLINPSGTSEVYGDYMFRQSSVQRYTYNKGKLRDFFSDEDLLDTFLTVDKTAVDKYVKENLESLGGFNRTEFLEAQGNPYSVTKLEKVK